MGLEAVGGRCLWACEIDKLARMTYKANFKDPPYYDIREADCSKLPKYDLCAAGFPCQDFTGLSEEQKGLAGSHGALFYEVVRFLKECRPRMFLGENVKGLETMQDGAVLKEVISQLEALGYCVHTGVINSTCYTVQYRRRLFIVAFLEHEVSAVELAKMIDGAQEVAAASSSPTPSSSSSAPKAPDDLNAFVFPTPPVFSPARSIADILHKEGEDPFIEVYKLSKRQWDNVRGAKSTKKYGVERRLIRPNDPNAHVDTLLKGYRRSRHTHAQFVKFDDSQHPRWFTPRECARLMGFTEDFLLPPGISIYEQFGNAVVPEVVALIAGAMLAHRAKQDGASVEVQETLARKGIAASVNLCLNAVAPPSRAKLQASTAAHPLLPEGKCIVKDLCPDC
jgi:DNA (cytosine-5)-methyltransferase 1